MSEHFVVQGLIPYEGAEVKGVFSDKETAIVYGNSLRGVSIVEDIVVDQWQGENFIDREYLKDGR